MPQAHESVEFLRYSGVRSPITAEVMLPLQKSSEKSGYRCAAHCYYKKKEDSERQIYYSDKFTPASKQDPNTTWFIIPMPEKKGLF